MKIKYIDSYSMFLKKCGTFLLIDSIASSGHRFAIAVKLMRIFRIQNGDLGFFANVDL